MNIKVVKTVVSLVSQISAGTVISNIAKATTPATVTRLGRITTTIGAVVLGGMVGDMAAKYALGEVDKIHDWITSKNN